MTSNFKVSINCPECGHTVGFRIEAGEGRCPCEAQLCECVKCGHLQDIPKQ